METTQLAEKKFSPSGKDATTKVTETTNPPDCDPNKICRSLPVINQDSFSFKNIHSLRFVFQAAFSTLILIFCLYQLYISKGEGKNDAIYWGGVTGTLALWMPSPSTSGTLPTNQPNYETTESADGRH